MWTFENFKSPIIKAVHKLAPKGRAKRIKIQVFPHSSQTVTAAPRIELRHMRITIWNP
jgi:hypothetical protein